MQQVKMDTNNKINPGTKGGSPLALETKDPK
jgi:hypothetical protein